MGERGQDRTASATVVLAQRVCPGREDEYDTWQSGINRAARQFPGFEGVEVVRPVPGVQDDHVVVYRFDTTDQLSTWLGSKERAEWIARGEPLFVEAPIQHTIVTPKSDAVTVVVTHRVKPGSDKAYREWQRGIDRDLRLFRGFESTDVFEPSAHQRDWVVVFRFDSATNLQVWLDSAERAEWLTRAAPLLDSWDLQKISGGLGGWFDANAEGTDARVAPAWKQAMAVMLALFPTVMVLRLLLAPQLTGLPVPLQVLMSSAVSVALLMWLLMPCVTWSLRAWLDPRASPRATLIGTGALLAAYAAMTGAFFLATL